MTGFATMTRVRLKPEQRAAQPEIGDTIGVVFGTEGETVEVEWPSARLQAWHKAADLEPVP